MLGYALGFGLLFILVCKNLYSEEECSTYEYVTNDNDETMGQPQVSDERSSFGPVMLPIISSVIVGFIILVFFIPRRIRDTTQSVVGTEQQSDTGRQQSDTGQQQSDTTEQDLLRKAFAVNASQVSF